MASLLTQPQKNSFPQKRVPHKSRGQSSSGCMEDVWKQTELLTLLTPETLKTMTSVPKNASHFRGRKVFETSFEGSKRGHSQNRIHKTTKRNPSKTDSHPPTPPHPPTAQNRLLPQTHHVGLEGGRFRGQALSGAARLPSYSRFGLVACRAPNQRLAWFTKPNQARRRENTDRIET